ELVALTRSTRANNKGHAVVAITDARIPASSLSMHNHTDFVTYTRRPSPSSIEVYISVAGVGPHRDPPLGESQFRSDRSLRVLPVAPTPSFWCSSPVPG